MLLWYTAFFQASWHCHSATPLKVIVIQFVSILCPLPLNAELHEDRSFSYTLLYPHPAPSLLPDK